MKTPGFYNLQGIKLIKTNNLFEKLNMRVARHNINCTPLSCTPQLIARHNISKPIGFKK